MARLLSVDHVHSFIINHVLNTNFALAFMTSRLYLSGRLLFVETLTRIHNFTWLPLFPVIIFVHIFDRFGSSINRCFCSGSDDFLRQLSLLLLL